LSFHIFGIIPGQANDFKPVAVAWLCNFWLGDNRRGGSSHKSIFMVRLPCYVYLCYIKLWP